MINLEKGQRVDAGLEKVCVGLGWGTNRDGGDAPPGCYRNF